MKIKIRVYQIDLQEDRKNVKFQPFSIMRKRMGISNNEVDASIYKKVFDGEVPCERLEDVYSLLNAAEKPEGYSGHSLSVSDVVEVEDRRDLSLKLFYVDTLGFKLIGFLNLVQLIY